MVDIIEREGGVVIAHTTTSLSKALFERTGEVRRSCLVVRRGLLTSRSYRCAGSKLDAGDLRATQRFRDKL